MFPVPLYIEIGAVVLMAVLGFVIGAFTGGLASRVLKVPRDRFWKDGLLGALGFVLGFLGCIFLPFVTGAREMVDYPQWVALAFAVALPSLREWLRSRKARRSQSAR